MIFSQYKKLLKQIDELQKPICTLEKSQRMELLELSNRQEYFEKDIEESLRLVIGELRQYLDDFENWLNDTVGVVDRTFGPGGTPQEIVALEETFNRIRLIKEQILSLVGPELEVAAAAKAEELPLLLPPASLKKNINKEEQSERKLILVQKVSKPSWLKEETMQRVKEKLQALFPAEKTVRQFLRDPFTDREANKLERLLGEIYK